MNAKTKRLLSLLLALVLSLSMVTVAVVATDNDTPAEPEEAVTESKYDSIDIDEITNQGGNPPEITGAASTLAAQKQWYEYISYNDKGVASLRINDERRVIFYDPYDYNAAMIMEVTGTDSEWSSANSLTISYTTSNSINDQVSNSTNTSSSIQVQEGEDTNGSTSSSESHTATTNWSSQNSYKLSSTIGAKLGTKETIGAVGTGFELSAEVSASATVDNGWSDTSGGSDANQNSSSETSGWSRLANRVTTVTGSSTTTNKSWSTTDSKTVSRTFNATYFNDRGSPLQWKIVQYTVYMPMKYELQCKMDGEWVTTDSSYCLLETMQGTCRAWMEYNVAYVEHWGTGEPIAWNDFWGSFYTEESLLQAYQSKLYPDS